ncbi:MAG: undecaprenyldiphospho-muramoylpentapeptide beta-N-acetylglucosaminyltransferase [Bryobacterales bacterium]|nr:undecaprenyldiphospho-muramoylpentapeptide beta-N-acetylglucosaminyltransferase [Bryobacterales bacterium]
MKLKIRIDTPEVTSAAPQQRQVFLMTGGGTGGHVIPLIAVARELRKRGHEVFFIGTEEGLESRLVPPEEMPIAFIKIGGLQRVGWRQTLRTLLQLPVAVWKSMELIRQHKPNAVFCLGGFVAGPPVIAAWLLRKPVVLMEPNAIPGMVNRNLARVARRALLSFPEAQRFFPKGRAEITGLPVRAEFFRLPRRKPGDVLTVLVTGGSRGSRRLNEAGRNCWKLFQESQVRVRWIHQTGTADYTEMASAFAESGAEGQVVPFIENMPQVFGTADLVVCRSGAGAVSELAAAGKPAILVPFPYAADQHQLKNAEAMARAGAARLILDATLTGEELFHTIRDLAADPVQLERMGEAARQFAKPGAAIRAVEVLEREGMRRKRA